MEKERLVLLKAEIEAQLDAIAEIYLKIDLRKKETGPAAAESLGYQLHNLYCAFEDLFSMVAAFFENHLEDKSRYHSELLKRMTLSVQGVRPAFLSRNSFVLLDNLRAFRHFFRHAYSYDLDERKLRIVLEDAEKLRPLYRREGQDFISKLQG
ncbi:MAG: hypothetical protein KGZ57_04105 [Dethiobacter sp.]|nr:hypothetical protein [Dethiobacter sp.]